MCTRLDVRDLRPAPGATIGLGSQAYHLLSSTTDLQDNEIRGAAGALLGHMLSLGISNLDGFISVSRILPIDYVTSMQADADTLHALGIFIQEKHPNVLKSYGRSKEGLSIFNLLDRTRSLPGRTRLREWLARPFCDINRINQRLDGVEIFTRTENLEWAAEVSKHLRKIKDVSSLLTRVKKAEARFQDWVSLLGSCENLLAVADCVLAFISHAAIETNINTELTLNCVGEEEQERVKYANFLRLQWQGVQGSVLTTNLQTLMNVISIPESIAQEQLVVRSGYDTQLDTLRETYAELECTLAHTARCILQKYPIIDRAGVEYVPQIGFLVSIAHSEETTILSINSASANAPLKDTTPFELIYSAGDLDMYKTNEVRELDEQIGDIRHAVQDRQRALLVDAEDTLLLCEGPWRLIADCAASLDAVMSLGVVARERDYVRPIITADKVIAIKSGRHPIQEITVDDFVPNDTFLDGDRNVAVVTGPNSSGKSVYLKQIGLLTYMAHIGCFVPCQRALVGLCDRLLTRIATVESSSTPQSAFTLDLSQMSRMLKAHTSRSLCLIDEFGKGTAPEDGVALLASTMEYFADNPQRTRCVFVLNYTEVLTPGLLKEVTLGHMLCFRMASYEKIYATIDSVVSATVNSEKMQTIEDEDTPCVPLFRLEMGVAPTALGVQCAAAAGVDERIVCRAKEIRSAIQDSRPIASPSTNKSLLATNVLQHTSATQLLQCFLKIKDWSSAADTVLSDLHTLLKLAARESINKSATAHE